VEYVYQKLLAAGYNPILQSFTIVSNTAVGRPTLQMTYPKSVTYRLNTDFIMATGSGNGNLVSTPTFAVANYGCQTSDFAGFPPGAIAVISRSPLEPTNPTDTCTFGQKTNLSIAAQASGAIIYNDGTANDRLNIISGTLEGIYNIPVFFTTFFVGDHLSCAAANVSMSVQTETISVTSNNIIADTNTGDKNNIIAIGAHLDSVPAGPGINDDGSGSATILEIALQVAANGMDNFAKPNALRFCWWSGEELGLLGSTAYVRALLSNDSHSTLGDLTQIAAYLNFDMLGSPNFFRGVLNGSSAEQAREGCIQIKTMFERSLNASIGYGNYETAPDFGPRYRSDYGPFVTAGVPAGGLFTGAEVIKTTGQRKVYGGLAGIAYDPCYHLACDTTDNIDEDVLELFSKTAARVMQELSGKENVREFLNPAVTNSSEVQSVDWDHFARRQTMVNYY